MNIVKDTLNIEPQKVSVELINMCPFWNLPLTTCFIQPQMFLVECYIIWNTQDDLNEAINFLCQKFSWLVSHAKIVWDACIYIFGDGISQFMFFCMWVIFSETIWWLLLPFCHNRKGVWHIQTRHNTFLSTIEDNNFHSLYDVKDYAHKNHNLALQWDGKSQDYSLERNDNPLQLLIDNLQVSPTHGQ